VVIDVQTPPDALVLQHCGQGLLKLRENVEHKPPSQENVGRPSDRTEIYAEIGLGKAAELMKRPG
jgi:hypothetical protein